jgi:hypothetical protein
VHSGLVTVVYMVKRKSMNSLSVIVLERYADKHTQIRAEVHGQVVRTFALYV